MNPAFIPLIFFIAAVICFALLSVVLIYHWHRYGQGSLLVITFEALYLAVGIGLLSLALGLMLTLL